MRVGSENAHEDGEDSRHRADIFDEWDEDGGHGAPSNHSNY